MSAMHYTETPYRGYTRMLPQIEIRSYHSRVEPVLTIQKRINDALAFTAFLLVVMLFCTVWQGPTS